MNRIVKGSEHYGGEKKPFYTVTCSVHGLTDRGSNIKWIKVPEPKNKKLKLYGGKCPYCQGNKEIWR